MLVQEIAVPPSWGMVLFSSIPPFTLVHSGVRVRWVWVIELVSGGVSGVCPVHSLACVSLRVHGA